MGTEKRLIDANALMEAVRQEDERSGNKWTSYDFDCLISTQPTVDAVEVVHGRWDKVYEDGHFRGHIHKKCGGRSYAASAYCPNCGAKMDGVSDG